MTLRAVSKTKGYRFATFVARLKGCRHQPASQPVNSYAQPVNLYVQPVNSYAQPVNLYVQPVKFYAQPVNLYV
ncbi:hypothetical protein MY1884_009720 [Beauveria asiatica]